MRAELEWPDAVTAVPPPGWRWSDQCFWIVNSSGVANDPQRRMVRQGGQLHTPVTASADELAAACHPLFERLAPVPNYRSSMRVSLRVPQLQHDLAALRRVTEFTRAHLPPLWAAVDPVDPLIAGVGERGDDAARKGAYARLTATLRSRHFLMAEDTHRQRMRAPDVAAFAAVEPVPTAGTSRAWSPPIRESLDVRAVADNGWVTFRCFAQAADAAQLLAAAQLATAWIGAALDGGDPGGAVTPWQARLPRQRRYVHELEQGWLATNFHHHARRVVAARLAARGFVTG